MYIITEFHENKHICVKGCMIIFLVTYDKHFFSKT